MFSLDHRANGRAELYRLMRPGIFETPVELSARSNIEANMASRLLSQMFTTDWRIVSRRRKSREIRGDRSLWEYSLRVEPIFGYATIPDGEAGRLDGWYSKRGISAEGEQMLTRDQRERMLATPELSMGLPFPPDMPAPRASLRALHERIADVTACLELLAESVAELERAAEAHK